MCNIGKAFERIVTVPGTGGAEAAQIQQQGEQQKQTQLLAQQQQASTAAITEAMQAQTKAVEAARKAALPVSDSASAREAAEERMRRLMSGASFSKTSGAQFFGEPPTGYKMLTGM